MQRPVAIASLPALLRRCRTGRRGLWIVLGLYCALYGTLLLSADFAPYVLDNNESYSSLNHARNLVTFGPGKSMGLADEAVSPSPQAHPVVHTHQGNVPRLFATLLYLAGITSVEGQTAVTAFTVGVAVIAMAFTLFRLCAGSSFAMLACLALMTDYMFFAQWHINTYRIWIPFFVLSSLLTAEFYVRTRERRWLVLMALNSLFLFYYELAFVSFAASMTAVYLAWRLRHDWRALLGGWIAIALGGSAALAILLLQVAAYLGWDGLLTDALLTYRARNFATDGMAIRTALEAFYGERNIAFFYNIGSKPAASWLSGLWTFVAAGHAQVLTPFISLMAFVALAGHGSRLAARRISARRAAAWIMPTCGALPAALALLAGFFCVQLLWLSDALSLRVASSSLTELAMGAAATAILTALAVTCAYKAATALGPSAALATVPTRLLCACGFLLVVLLWMSGEAGLYSPLLAAVWSGALAPPGWPLWHNLAVIAALAAWTAAILLPRPRRAATRNRECLHALFASGAAGMVVMYTLFPGYLHSGYLARGETVIAVQLAALLAFALHVSLGLAREFRLRARIMRTAQPHSGQAQRGVRLLRAPALMAAIAAVGAILQWTCIQAGYMRLFPPDAFAWTRVLASPELRGKSVVSNNYVVPYALLTGGWGYYSSYIASAGRDLETGSIDPSKSNAGIWLADARSNPAYARPDLFVCFITPSLHRTALRLGGSWLHGCRSLGLVRGALERGGRGYPHSILAIDSEASDAWAIVRLDWEAASRGLRR